MDGILKHSSLVEEKERRLYKEIFGSYQKIFWKDNDIDTEKKENLNKTLFEYISPLTYEGIIVAIADDIAQLCHDIEDIRRLGGFDGVKNFYKNVCTKLGEVKADLPKNIQEAYDDFDEFFKNPEKQIIKLERLYIKLILGIYIPFASKMIQRLVNMEWHLREQLLKSKDLTKFKNLKELQQELKLELNEIKTIECFEELSKEYRKLLFCLPAAAKWDMKGKELYLELHKKHYEAFCHKACREDGISLAILDYDKRDDIKKSYDAGKDFESLIREEQEQKIDGIPIKFAVWDYLAGMTDNFIIKSYEELTFKRVELR